MSRQAMSRGGDQYQLVEGKWLDLYWNFGRNGSHNGHIDAIVDECINECGPVQYFQRYLNLRINLVKLSKQARNDIRPHRCISSYTQAAIVGTSQLFNHSQRFFDHGKHFLTVNVEFFA